MLGSAVILIDNVVVVCNHAAAVSQPRNQVSNTLGICGRENPIRVLDGVLVRCNTATAAVVLIELLRLRVDR